MGARMVAFLESLFSGLDCLDCLAEKGSPKISRIELRCWLMSDLDARDFGMHCKRFPDGLCLLQTTSKLPLLASWRFRLQSPRWSGRGPYFSSRRFFSASLVLLRQA